MWWLSARCFRQATWSFQSTRVGGSTPSELMPAFRWRKRTWTRTILVARAYGIILQSALRTLGSFIEKVAKCCILHAESHFSGATISGVVRIELNHLMSLQIEVAWVTQWWIVYCPGKKAARSNRSAGVKEEPNLHGTKGAQMSWFCFMCSRKDGSFDGASFKMPIDHAYCCILSQYIRAMYRYGCRIIPNGWKRMEKRHSSWMGYSDIKNI